MTVHPRLSNDRCDRTSFRRPHRLLARSGGRFTRFARDGVDLFQPADLAPSMTLMRNRLFVGGCFPMAPWVSRVRGGWLPFEGDKVHLKFRARHLHAFHGHGWRRPEGGALARVRQLGSRRRGRRGRLAGCVSGGADGPSWRGRSVDYTGVPNTGEREMPVGLGLHPFFPKHGDVGLMYTVTNAWPPSDGAFPTGATGLPDRLDFSSPGPLVTGVDQLGGWSGGHLIWPGKGLALTVGWCQSEHLVYSPEDQDHFCRASDPRSRRLQPLHERR